MKFFEEAQVMQQSDRKERDAATPTPEMNVWPVIPAYPGTEIDMTPGMNTRPITLPGMDMDANTSTSPGMNTRPIIVPGMDSSPQRPEPEMPQRPGMGSPQRPEPEMPQRPGMGRPQRPDMRPPMVTGTVITTYPRPGEPCRFCDQNNGQYATVRFLNASAGYVPFTVYVDENIAIRNLQQGEVSAYTKVGSKSHTMTLVGPENYVYFQKSLDLPKDGVFTVAIVNAKSGLDLLLIEDEVCRGRFGAGCIRAVNLSPVSGPLNVMSGNQENNFINLQYGNVAKYRDIRPGYYRYHVTRNMFRGLPEAGSGVVLATAAVEVRAGSAITIYIFNWNAYQPDAVRTLVVEERMQDEME
ncbi:MAG: DUF4397 domain-containing protein [Lachnospiraceae bacterium]|nr:DUF4397 domain-containing protein [Lachnospiraceae bacterium]